MFLHNEENKEIIGEAAIDLFTLERFLINDVYELTVVKEREVDAFTASTSRWQSHRNSPNYALLCNGTDLS